MTYLLQIICGLTEGHQLEFFSLRCRLCDMTLEAYGNAGPRLRRFYALLAWWHAPGRAWGLGQPVIALIDTTFVAIPGGAEQGMH